MERVAGAGRVAGEGEDDRLLAVHESLSDGDDIFSLLTAAGTAGDTVAVGVTGDPVP